MITLSVNSLSLGIGIKEILTDISFSVEEGDRLGIVGVNGSGKSTLLRLLCGKLSPDSGEIYIAKDRTVGMMEQNDAFDTAVRDDTVLSHMYGAVPELCRLEAKLAELETALQSADEDTAARVCGEFTRTNERFISAGGLEYKSRCRSLLRGLGFEDSMLEMKVGSLSGGQRTRLELARLLFREPDILMLDEPTNHLDTKTMIWLEGHLSAYKKTLIVVSHDRYFLDKVTNKTLDIEHHHAALYKCAYTEFVKRKEEKRKSDMKRWELQQKEIARLEAYIEQQRRWNRERNIIAAESREKAIERMEKVERPKDAPKAISFSFGAAGESGNDVLSVKNLSMSFGEKQVFSNVSFEVKKREHLFIAGSNGCGKSTLLKILLGKLCQTGGKAEFGYNVHIGYYDQENQQLDEHKTVLDELWDAYPAATQTQIRSTLAAFMFRGDDILKEVSVLSGGERARLTLAKLIMSKMNVLILDEPTNHLDIPSREALEAALAEFDGTIIAVSHDRYFTRRLATRIICLDAPFASYTDFDDYEMSLEGKKPDGTAAKDGTSPAAAASGGIPAVQSAAGGKEAYLQRKADASQRRREAAYRRKVEAEIAGLEAELANITDELFGDAATDYVRAGELDDRRITVEDRLMQLYEEQEGFSVADDMEE